jgi:hypothetical protein
MPSQYSRTPQGASRIWVGGGGVAKEQGEWEQGEARSVSASARQAGRAPSQCGAGTQKCGAGALATRRGHSEVRPSESPRASLVGGRPAAGRGGSWRGGACMPRARLMNPKPNLSGLAFAWSKSARAGGALHCAAKAKRQPASIPAARCRSLAALLATPALLPPPPSSRPRPYLARSLSAQRTPSGLLLQALHQPQSPAPPQHPSPPPHLPG